MNNVALLYKKKQELFIEGRTNNANEVEKFLNGLSKVDPKLLPKDKQLRGKTAKEILPSMWEEPFNEKKFQVELAEFNSYVDAVMTVADRINAEALEVLR